MDTEHPSPPIDPSAHEEDPQNLPVGISINDLTKIYGRYVSYILYIQNALDIRWGQEPITTRS